MWFGLSAGGKSLADVKSRNLQLFCCSPETSLATPSSAVQPQHCRFHKNQAGGQELKLDLKHDATIQSLTQDKLPLINEELNGIWTAGVLVP